MPRIREARHGGLREARGKVPGEGAALGLDVLGDALHDQVGVHDGAVELVAHLQPAVHHRHVVREQEPFPDMLRQPIHDEPGRVAASLGVDVVQAHARAAAAQELARDHEADAPAPAAKDRRHRIVDLMHPRLVRDGPALHGIRGGGMLGVPLLPCTDGVVGLFGGLVGIFLLLLVLHPHQQSAHGVHCTHP